MWISGLCLLTRHTAEQALATLQDFPISSPVFHLELSPYASDSLAIPLLPLPQFIKCNPAHPFLHMNAQELFALFRAAGPLVSLRVEVQVGYPNLVPVIHYWNIQDSRNAANILAFICAQREERMPIFLQTYNPCNLYLPVRNAELLVVFIEYCLTSLSRFPVS